MIKQYSVLLLLFTITACANATTPKIGCSDGQPPIRVVSADGSYFTGQEICAGDLPDPATLNSIDASYDSPLMQPIPAGVDYSFYKTSDFVDLKIPVDFDFVDERRLRYLMEQGEYRGYSNNWDKQERYKTKHGGCKAVLQHFVMANDDARVERWAPDNSVLHIITKGNHKAMTECIQDVPLLMHFDYEYVINDMADIILHHATYRNVREDYLISDINHMQYQKYQLMARTAEFYAYFKDLMPLTPPEHDVIKAYFDEVFMGNPFHTQQKRAQCDVKNPERNSTSKNKYNGVNGQTGIGKNGCGTYNFNMVNAALLYSVATNNQTLFEQAKKNVTHLLGTFDDEGIQTMQASRGQLAWGYHANVTIQLNYMSEIFYSIGYKFLEHKMPRSGITVKQVMFKHWEAIDDHNVLEKYAKNNRGIYQKWTPEFSKIPTSKATAREMPWLHIALSSPRFINEHVTVMSIWGTEINMPETIAKKQGGANNWYQQWVPNEYLYYMNKNRL